MTNRFNIDDYKGQDVAMWCNTPEKAQTFVEHLSNLGKEWANGDDYLDDNMWYVYKDQTLYSFNDDTFGSLGVTGVVTDVILNFDDFDWSIDYPTKSWNLEDLNGLILLWAKERNFQTGGTIEGQTIKVLEECAELIQGISKDNINLIVDSIGDVYVSMLIREWLALEFVDEKLFEHKELRSKTKVEMLNELSECMMGISDNFQSILGVHIRLFKLLNSIAYVYNLDFRECVECAYNEIKDRKGEMIKGMFVKEGDLCK